MEISRQAPPASAVLFMSELRKPLFVVLILRSESASSRRPISQTWTFKSGGALPVGLTALCGAAGLASAETMAAMLTARPGGGGGDPLYLADLPRFS